MKTPRHHFTDEQDETIMYLYYEHKPAKSMTQIAERMGLNRGQIMHRIQQLRQKPELPKLWDFSGDNLTGKDLV